MIAQPQPQTSKLPLNEMTVEELTEQREAAHLRKKIRDNQAYWKRRLDSY